MRDEPLRFASGSEAINQKEQMIDNVFPLWQRLCYHHENQPCNDGNEDSMENPRKRRQTK